MVIGAVMLTLDSIVYTAMLDIFYVKMQIEITKLSNER